MGKRRTSIEARVALWYAAFFVLFIWIVAMLVFYVNQSIVVEHTQRDLSEAVAMTVDGIGITDGRITISPIIEYDGEEATIALYDEDERDISGILPDDFPQDTEFVDDEIRNVQGKEKQYFVCDRLIESPAAGDLWVRGVTSAELKDMAPDFLRLVGYLVFLLPIVFISALLGGLFITHRAFIPLKQITDTAVWISESGDLTQRIGFGDSKSKDEVLRAAGVFDDMLDKLERAFNDEKQFTNDASHELRTPTAVIMAQSEFALSDPDDKEEVISSLKTILKESKKMDTLVSQLLILARADHGTLKLAVEHTDISLLAEETCESLRPFASAKNITIRTKCDEGVYLDVDPVFFSKVYDNLINNAIKYGKEGGHITVAVHQNHEMVNSEKGIIITIKDDGIGISEDALPHIFDRFYRENRSFAKDSIGLGLPIVGWIVAKHGGNITCSSKKDKGTTFTIIF